MPEIVIETTPFYKKFVTVKTLKLAAAATAVAVVALGAYKVKTVLSTESSDTDAA